MGGELWSNSTTKTGEPPHSMCSHQLWAMPGTVGHPHGRNGGTSSQQPWPCGASALSLWCRRLWLVRRNAFHIAELYACTSTITHTPHHTHTHTHTEHWNKNVIKWCLSLLKCDKFWLCFHSFQFDQKQLHNHPLGFSLCWEEAWHQTLSEVTRP